jgi:integration host factor subunit beta
MKKIQLIQSLQNNDNLELNKSNAKKSVDIIIDEITNAIAAGNGVEIRGFGSFSKKHMAPRIGINPRTGEKTNVDAKNVPFFKPGKELKNLVNNQ